MKIVEMKQSPAANENRLLHRTKHLLPKTDKSMNYSPLKSLVRSVKTTQQ
jgi:microcystin degradation protein MlrC